MAAELAYEDGWALYRAGDYGSAVRRLSDALRITSITREIRLYVLLARAAAFGKLHRFHEAMVDATAVAMLDLLASPPWLYKGFSLQRLELHLQAIEALNEVLVRSPGDLDANSNLGYSYQKLNRHKEAIEAYTIAHAADDSDTYLLINRYVDIDHDAMSIVSD